MNDWMLDTIGGTEFGLFFLNHHLCLVSRDYFLYYIFGGVKIQYSKILYSMSLGVKPAHRPGQLSLRHPFGMVKPAALLDGCDES